MALAVYLLSVTLRSLWLGNLMKKAGGSQDPPTVDYLLISAISTVVGYLEKYLDNQMPLGIVSWVRG